MSTQLHDMLMASRTFSQRQHWLIGTNDIVKVVVVKVGLIAMLTKR